MRLLAATASDGVSAPDRREQVGQIVFAPVNSANAADQWTRQCYLKTAG